MSLKVNLKKTVFTKLICLFALLGCRTINSASFTNGNSQELEDYKRMTKHIVDSNYHDGFKRSLVIGRNTTSDSALINFMIKRRITGIHTIGKIEASEEYIAKHLPLHRDSIIEYHFKFVPIFGKRKELKFDFSSDPPTESYKKNGVRLVVLEKGIYYVEY